MGFGITHGLGQPGSCRLVGNQPRGNCDRASCRGVRGTPWLRRAATINLLASWLVAASPAVNAQQALLWPDGNSFTTFGPNQLVIIDLGIMDIKCDDFFPATNIHVVNSGEVCLGCALTEASGGINTVVGTGQGLFISEIIASTMPIPGGLGSGLYAVVYDECQDGMFDLDDVVFEPSSGGLNCPGCHVEFGGFEVILPSVLPPIDPAIIEIKASAGAQAQDLQIMQSRLVPFFHLLEALEKGVAAFELFHGNPYHAIVWVANHLAQTSSGIHPIQIAITQVANAVNHYQGIAADPPDPNFEQITALGAVQFIIPQTDDPLVVAGGAMLGNSLGLESALAGALLRSIERYQGAAMAGNGEWALIHARTARDYMNHLANQLTLTNAALAALSDALTADGQDLDGTAQVLGEYSTRIENEGFGELELLILDRLGLSAQQIEEVRIQFDGIDFAEFSEAAVLASNAHLIATNVSAISALELDAALVDAIVQTLSMDPSIPQQVPVADAGGPYLAVEGVPVQLNALESFDPDGIILSFEWDLDGDTDFDDAAGPTPTATISHAFEGLVGVKVTDDTGRMNIAYAPVDVTNINNPPVITGFLPTEEILLLNLGDTIAFEVTASDPEKDRLLFEWFVDQVPASISPMFDYTPVDSADIGSHSIRVVISDNSGLGGFVSEDWTVGVFSSIPGACCLSNGSCGQATAEECESGNGIFEGEATACNEVVCQVSLGACCLGKGSCAELSLEACGTQGGKYQGDGSTCSTTCPPCADVDGDIICDDRDNCPSVPNEDQADIDNDGVGDGCDKCPHDPADDADADGVCADADNCRWTPNPAQEDANGNGIGDACEIANVDPHLEWSTFLGGSTHDRVTAVAVHEASGDVIVVGRTRSSDFPETPGAFVQRGAGYDVFVTRLTADGSELVYSVIFGGGGHDIATSVSVDPGGTVTVAGQARGGFPITPDAYDTSYNGGTDGFVARLHADGGSLIYSTYIGGSANEELTAMAVDDAGSAVVVGSTYSTDFPTTPGVVQPQHAGGSCFCGTAPGPCADGFIARLDPNGAGLEMSTYLGGNQWVVCGGPQDSVHAVALDPSGVIVVAGSTSAADFPVTPGVHRTTHAGGHGSDGFITKINPSGTEILLSTFFGGAGGSAPPGQWGSDQASNLALHGSYVIVAGNSNAQFYGYNLQYGNDASFVAWFDEMLTDLQHLKVLGGSAFDCTTLGLAVDESGIVTVAGDTNSTNLPTTCGALDRSFNGPGGNTCAVGDFFVARMQVQPDGEVATLYSTYLGGSEADGYWLSDYTGTLAQATDHRVVFVGTSNSFDFPITADAFQPTRMGGIEGVVSMFCFGPECILDCNGNGTPDGCDLSAGTSLDCEPNGIPDECQPVVSDLDRDGDTDASDLAILLGSWGPCECCPADLDADAMVTMLDLDTLLMHWDF